MDDSGIHETPKILFDGKAGFQFGSGTEGSNAGDDNLDWIITFLELAGFEIQGPNQEITYAEASSNRTNAKTSVQQVPPIPVQQEICIMEGGL